MENKWEEMKITLETFDFGESAAEESGREEDVAVTLKTLDGRELALSSAKADAVAKQSFRIWKILREAKTRRTVEMPLGWRILAMAIDYCFEHGKDKKLTFDDFIDENGNYFPEKFPDKIKANEAIDEKLSKWDEAFLQDCDAETILELVTAARHLWVTGLRDLVGQAAMDMMIGKSGKEIVEMFLGKLEKDIQEVDRENELMGHRSVMKGPELVDMRDVVESLGPPGFGSI
ncbi:SKP1-like protein 19 [Asparagus officinalis]|nr:SKP1-like protein 19 [Asparagus officinalis]